MHCRVPHVNNVMGGVFGFGNIWSVGFMIIAYLTHPFLPVHETNSLYPLRMKWIISRTHQQLEIEIIQKCKLCFDHCLKVPFSLCCMNALSQNRKAVFLEGGGEGREAMGVFAWEQFILFAFTCSLDGKDPYKTSVNDLIMLSFKSPFAGKIIYVI